MYYAASAITRYAGQEFPHMFLVEAKNDTEAAEVAEAVLRNWWEDEEMRIKDRRYFFFTDTYVVWLREVNAVSEATAKELQTIHLLWLLTPPALDYREAYDLYEYVCEHGKEYASYKDAPPLPKDAERIAVDDDGRYRIIMHSGWPVAAEETFNDVLFVYAL